jgi:hypothetical protein
MNEINFAGGLYTRVASLVSMQSGVVYAMTKGAMNMLTKYLACEWAKVRRGCKLETPLLLLRHRCCC